MSHMGSLQRFAYEAARCLLFAASMALVAAPALAVPVVSFTKTPDGLPSINPGELATFTYTIKNIGDADATSTQLEDLLPAGGGIIWETNSPNCGVFGLVGAQTFECDFDELLVGEQNAIVATVFGTPNSCTELTSTATLFSVAATPQEYSDEGTIIVACPQRPMFVIGDDEPHGVGQVVNFWGSQWWKNNFMSNGAANGTASFKGYATESDLTCGGNWVSRVGNSPPPPDTIPQNVLIIVTDRIGKAGPNITGKIVKILQVKSDGGYGPAPGHRGNGEVLSVNCSL